MHRRSASRWNSWKSASNASGGQGRSPSLAGLASQGWELVASALHADQGGQFAGMSRQIRENFSQGPTVVARARSIPARTPP